MYKYEDVLLDSINYFNGDDLAAKVWVDKYCLKDNKGNIYEKNPADMHRRIAKEFGRIQKQKYKTPLLNEDDIFNLLDKFKYIIPQGSPMFGIGNNFQTISLSNCYLLDVPLDSYSSIVQVDEELVNISKRRGGVGIDLSNLRPKGTATNNAAKTSTGITTWMERYSNSIREVGQNNRRGALMLTLSIHHPDVMEFITIKNDDTKVTGANISVRLTKEFLDAVENDEEYELRFPVESKTPTISKMVKAKSVWNAIIHSAWLRAEPGLLMWDNVTDNTPADCYDTYSSKGTNPCSEINLSPLDSCRLLCLNLLSYVENPFSSNAYFNFEKFHKHSYFAQHLMDDLVDLEAEKIDAIINKVNKDPEPDYVKSREIDLWKKIKKFNNEGRRTGTGITALGDTLAAVGLSYGSEESIKLTEEIYRTLKLACYEASVDMAKELGSFVGYSSDAEKDCPYIQRIKKEAPTLYDKMVKYGRRNVALLTTAPTGTVSILTQTTSGIEPLFMIGYTRRTKINHNNENIRVDFVDKNGDSWQEYTVYHHQVKRWMEITGQTDIKNSPWYNSCAEDINWVNRVKLQAAAQNHVCHAISSTINLPENVAEEEVAKIYQTAFKSGCKGITIYRKNCRTGVLVDTSTKKEAFVKHNAPKRPRKLKCNIHHLVVKSVNYYVAVGLYENQPYEVFVGRNSNNEGESIIPRSRKSGFINKKKKGEYEILNDDGEIITTIYSAQCEEHEEALARMTSVALRHGADVHFITESLLKVRGEMNSFAKSIARALKVYIVDGTSTTDNCPTCEGIKLVYNSGCSTCYSCGFSKCM